MLVGVVAPVVGVVGMGVVTLIQEQVGEGGKKTVTCGGDRDGLACGHVTPSQQST